MKRLYTLLAIFLPAIVLAQSNFKPGYVLKNNGDTVKGYVNYREWTTSPRSIDFKTNATDKPQQFRPQDIHEFQVDGLETYVSYEGPLSLNEMSKTEIAESLDTSKIQDNVFLKKLAAGKFLTLFSYTNVGKKVFFIAGANNKPVELNFYEYYNEQRQVISSAVYKRQLMVYAITFHPGNNKLNNEVQQVDYKQEQLEALVDEINETKTKQTGTRKSLSRFYVGVAINNTASHVDNLYGSSNTKSTSPKLDIGIDVFANPNVQRLIFRADLSFSYINPKYTLPIGTADDTDEYSFDQYTFSFTPQILYNVYNEDHLKVYIDAGIGFNRSAYSNSEVKPIKQFNSLQPTPYKLNSSWVNFPLQAGVTLNNNVEICFTYTPTASYSNANYYYLSNRSMSLGIKYLFGKP